MRRIPPLWAIVGSFGFVVFALGCVGFAAVDSAQDDTLDVAYRSLQLFSTEGGDVPGQTPVALEIARFLAPLVALGFAAVVLRSVVELLREERLYGLRSGHVVICGLGRSGGALADVLGTGHSHRSQVVGIALDGANPGVARARNAHARVLLGNATEDKVLRRARVRVARAVVVLCGDDTTNAEVAAEVKRFVGRGPQPRILLGIKDRRLAMELVSALSSDGSVTPVNLPAKAASQMVDRLPAAPDGSEPHALIVGFGSLGQAVARQLIETSESNVVRITAVDREADRKAGAVRDEVGADHCCELADHPCDFVSHGFQSLAFLDGRPPVTAVFVCVSDDALSATLALQLRRSARLAVSTPIVVRVTEVDRGLGGLLGDHAASKQITLFGAHDAAADLAQMIPED